MTATPNPPSFEDALTRLESIVRQIEEGRIGLEESIKLYEQGIGLLSHCRKVLDQAELRIQTLQQQAEEPPGGRPAGG
jgi:exodeoxyribonuclease VII small subunit